MGDGCVDLFDGAGFVIVCWWDVWIGLLGTYERCVVVCMLGRFEGFRGCGLAGVVGFGVLVWWLICLLRVLFAGVAALEYSPWCFADLDLIFVGFGL